MTEDDRVIRSHEINIASALIGTERRFRNDNRFRDTFVGDNDFHVHPAKKFPVRVTGNGSQVEGSRVEVNVRGTVIQSGDPSLFRIIHVLYGDREGRRGILG